MAWMEWSVTRLQHLAVIPGVCRLACVVYGKMWPFPVGMYGMRSCTVSVSVLFVDTHVFACSQACGEGNV